MADGFVPLRRGLIEHLEEGLITVDEWAIFCYLLSKADFKSGIVRTNAAKIKCLPHERVRKLLNRLRKKGYISYTTHRGGAGGDYNILIHNFDIKIDGQQARTPAQQDMQLLCNDAKIERPLTGHWVAIEVAIETSIEKAKKMPLIDVVLMLGIKWVALIRPLKNALGGHWVAIGPILNEREVRNKEEKLFLDAPNSKAVIKSDPNTSGSQSPTNQSLAAKGEETLTYAPSLQKPEQPQTGLSVSMISAEDTIGDVSEEQHALNQEKVGKMAKLIGGGG